MADFRTHVTTSSVLGVGYAGMGLSIGFPIETAIVGGGLCGVSGMLPDLDSDSGIPLRESTGFAAGIIPMLLIDRFQALNLHYDLIVLITAGLYFFIRFAGASLLGRFTVHRGMFHSIPAALIFAGVAFLICGYAEDRVRYFKAGAVLFGVMSHLLLDELYSIEWRGGGWRFKRSFGTAIKLWGKNGWANFSTYTKLAIVGVMVAGEPAAMNYLESRYPEFAGKVQRIHRAQEGLLGSVRDHVGVGTSEGDALAVPPPQTTPTPGANPSLPASTLPWESTFPQAHSQPWTPPPTSPAAPTGGGFSPNAGSATPIYRGANSGFAPR